MTTTKLTSDWAAYNKYDPDVLTATVLIGDRTFTASGVRGHAMTVRPITDDPTEYPDSVTAMWDDWKKVVAHFE